MSDRESPGEELSRAGEIGVTVVTGEGSDLHRAAGHPERPERLAAILGHLNSDQQLRRLPRRPAPAAEPDSVRLVHTAGHVRAVEAMSARGGGWFDADTYCTPHSYAIALGAAGAAMSAVDGVAAGACAGIALVRPPGHHATADLAMGFCLFNNAAIAVRHAQRDQGVERVAVIDIDVHHGNGTESIFWEDGSVLYTSLHQHPHYPGTGRVGNRGAGAGEGTTLNVPLPAGTDGPAWLAALDSRVIPAVEAFRPELIVVSAGYDAHEADPLAGLRLDAQAYHLAAQRVAALAGLSGRGSVWILEGGYDLDALAASVAASLRGLSDG